MVLVDTSVWIDAFNGKPSTKVDLLTALLLNGKPVCITPTILQEVLQGIRNDNDFERVKYTMSGFFILRGDQTEAAIGAANIYRHLRKNGITIRRANDCLIAFYAIKFNLSILHNDIDFENMAKHTSLLIY
jgi:predicted nucleic acid-binding protein